MSSQPTATPVQTPPGPPSPAAPTQIVIYSHSFLFYWWPVWFVGFTLALVSYWSGQVLAVVPEGTKAHVSTLQKEEVRKEEKDGKKKPGKLVETIVITNTETSTKTDDFTGRSILVLPEKTDVAEEGLKSVQPRLHISNSKNPGVFFLSVMLFVVFVTCVPLRGWLSITVIITIIALVIIFALAGLWDRILTQLSFIDIRINQGGYLFFSTVLFVMWLFVFLFYDKQIYATFSPNLVILKEAIGDQEKSYPANGITIQKLKGNFFLHVLLGLGTGDIEIRHNGALLHIFYNVRIGGQTLKDITDMLAMVRVTGTK